MSNAYGDHSDLAAALFYTMGASIPHDSRLEEEARKLLLSIPNQEKCLLKVIELCGTPETPKQLYILTKAYSWLGAKYRKETIRFSSQYLNSDGWGDLPHSVRTEDGISVSQSASCRASVFIDLAQAQEGEGDYEAALMNYLEAYRLEPYNAMDAIKAADVIAKSRSRKEAVDFLRNQKSSGYYLPIKYLDPQGNRCRNDTFKELLDSHLRKLEDKGK